MPTLLPLIHQPTRDLNPLTSPWPFAQWGMDIVGVLPRALRNKQFLLAAKDYFTKWVEAKPLAQIKEMVVIKFIYKNILSRFGIPRAIVSDNGRGIKGQRLVGAIEDRVLQLNNELTAVQRASQSHQQNNHEWDQEKA